MATDVCISKQWSQSSNFFFLAFLFVQQTLAHIFSPPWFTSCGGRTILRNVTASPYGRCWGNEVIMICNDDGTIQIDMARQKQIINYEDCKKIFLVYTEHGTGILVHLQWFLRQRKSAQDV